MEESRLVDRITPELRSQIIETTDFRYIIENNKTWNTYRLNSLLPR